MGSGRTPRALAVALAVGGVAAGCGGGAGLGRPFSTEWENDGGKSIAAVQRRLASARLPVGRGVAVGVTKSGLVASTLDGSKWKHAAKLDSRPTVTGDVVVGSGGGRVFALDAASGRRLWEVSSEGRALRGAGDDGSTTVVSLGERSGGGGLLFAVDRSGNVVRTFEPDTEAGVPAVLGGVAFIPWGNQYVSAIDLESGDEVGRLLMRDKVSHAVNAGGRLYFGEIAVVRFDEAIGAAPSGGAHRAALPERELPGKPTWFGPGAMVSPPVAAAPERIRLYAMPADAAGGLGIAGQRFVATYFRVVVGLSSKDGTLRWVRTLPKDVLGGAAAKGGFAMCDEAGKVWLLGARSGGDAGQLSLDAKLESCVVSAGSFEVPAGADTAPLAEQVGKAIELRMPQMVTAQRFLLRELGALEDETVTKILVELAGDPETPPMLLADARKLVASRRNGADYMLAALEKHYDFLSDVLLPPPVGPLADALAAMNETRAAPLLAEHINDPANSPDDVLRAARALTKLATPSELGELETFFALYRAAADQDALVGAAILAARTLVRIGGKEGAEVVRRAAADPMTHPAVQKGIESLVEPAAARGAEKASKG